MALSDHLNLIGSNPLRGPNDDRLGPRFPDMSEVYSRRLRPSPPRGRGPRVHPGRGGLRLPPRPKLRDPGRDPHAPDLGADVVGMSTVPEAIVARHAGMDVLAFALVTNAAAGITEPADHARGGLAGRRRGRSALSALIGAIVGKLRGGSPEAVD